MSGETLVFITIVLYALAAYYAIRISKILGSTFFWNLFIFALVLGPIRKIVVLLDINSTLSTFLSSNTIDIFRTIDRFYIPVIVSLCFAVGMHSLYEKLTIDNILKRKNKKKV